MGRYGLIVAILISIPTGTIKRIRGIQRKSRTVSFQFLLVRLKEKRRKDYLKK